LTQISWILFAAKKYRSFGQRCELNTACAPNRQKEGGQDMICAPGPRFVHGVEYIAARQDAVTGRNNDLRLY
jgi:hypothetical protein